MEKQKRTRNVHVGMVARAHGLPSKGDKRLGQRTSYNPPQYQSMSGEHQATRGDDGEREIEDTVSAVSLTQLSSGLGKCQELF